MTCRVFWWNLVYFGVFWWNFVYFGVYSNKVKVNDVSGHGHRHAPIQLGLRILTLT